MPLTITILSKQNEQLNQKIDRIKNDNENDFSLKGPGEIVEAALISLTGKYSLSLQTAVSGLMRKLLLTAIKVGQQNPSVNPEELLPVFSRRSLTKTMIKKGKCLYETHKKKFLDYRFISLNVDGGKLGSTNYFDIMITNALIPIKPMSPRSTLKKGY